MPKISHKGQQMPASPIRKLTPFADKAKLDGKKVYHLNIGQPDIETPEGMLNAIKDITFKVWAYTPSEGTLSYRKKLVEYYNKLGYNITPDNIIVTTGGSEAITISMMACLDPGDEVIIPEPFYANYNGFAISAGIEYRMTQSFFFGYGFSGILIAFLARNNPIGVIVVAFFVAILFVAGQSLQVFYQIPGAIVQLIQAIVVISVAAAEFFIRHRLKWTK